MSGLFSVVFAYRSFLKWRHHFRNVPLQNSELWSPFFFSQKTLKRLKSKLKPAFRKKRIGLLTKGFFCVTIVRDLILRLLPLKQSGTWNLSFSHNLVWCRPSSIWLLHVWVTKKDVGETKMMKLRTQSIHCFDHNRKRSSQIRKLVKPYTTCVEKMDHCFEIWYTAFL